MTPALFARRLLAWYDRHGRQDLPWQHPRTPYRVWLSEIMLQQTQVGTVIPYFQRFVMALPSLAELAASSEDRVLHLWSGLGYYSRARNLRQAARIVVEQHAGELPADMDALMALPGIGRSTAGAILAQAHDQRQPILDGNVKRVLARLHAIPGWPGQGAPLKKLWQLAEQYTPRNRVADYTQAIMDLGATLCTRSRPRCADCPVNSACTAHAQGRESDFPAAKPRQDKPVRSTRFLMVRRASGELYLERRPPSGVWGGLWCFPECPTAEAVEDWCEQELGMAASSARDWPVVRHSFSHFHLDITPTELLVVPKADGIHEQSEAVWLRPEATGQRGLAAPVQRLIQRLKETAPD